ncbi:MAG: hypothetical protein JRL30_01185 [Deltaproteobacteria bacterium]|nr:hypothetical protein [Deltaproteobacteria bacterium]
MDFVVDRADIYGKILVKEEDGMRTQDETQTQEARTMTTETTAHRTAITAYEERRASVKSLIEQIAKKLEEHDETFKNGDRTNWGFAGDLAYVQEGLEDIVDFLS